MVGVEEEVVVAEEGVVVTAGTGMVVAVVVVETVETDVDDIRRKNRVCDFL